MLGQNPGLATAERPRAWSSVFSSRRFLQPGAYWLTWTLRAALPARSPWLRAQFDTLALHLIKIAASRARRDRAQALRTDRVQAKDAFDKLKVGEVWLGWTEDVRDPLTAKLKAEKAQALAALRLGLSQLQLAAMPTRR